MRFTGCRALESSASVWQRCCAGKMGGGGLQWPAGKKRAPGVSGKKRDPFAFLLHCKSVCGQFRAPNSSSLSWILSAVFVIV